MQDLINKLIYIFNRNFLLLLILSFPLNANCQVSFQGSFLMTFHSSISTNDDTPLLWTIQPQLSGGKMAMEIEDVMRSKGVDKRIIFNPSDSTWSMLMAIGNVKQGTKIHRAMMYRDTIPDQKSKTITTKNKRLIEGFNCRKTTRETKDYITEFWITNQYNFNICKIYKLLSHCGMMSESIRKGDWFNWKNSKGMILEVTTKNKITNDSYTVSISQLKLNDVNLQLFNLTGYKISEIPEGQNCGPVVNEK